MSGLTESQKAHLCIELLETPRNFGDQPTSQFCVKYTIVTQFLEQIASGALVVAPPKAPRKPRPPKLSKKLGK